MDLLRNILKFGTCFSLSVLVWHLGTFDLFSIVWTPVAMLAWLYFSYLLTPFFLMIFSISYRVRNSPAEFPGSYYSITSNERFIFSSGVYPHGNNVFFSHGLLETVGRKAFVWAVAHEYYHYKRKHLLVNILVRVLVFVGVSVCPGMLMTELGIWGVGSWIFWITTCLIMYYISMYLQSSVTLEMEYNADQYATDCTGVREEDVAKLFSYLGYKHKYFPTHPDPVDRLTALYQISSTRAQELLQNKNT